MQPRRLCLDEVIAKVLLPLNIGEVQMVGCPSGANELIRIDGVVQSSVLPRFMTNGFIKTHKKWPCGVLLSQRPGYQANALRHCWNSINTVGEWRFHSHQSSENC